MVRAGSGSRRREPRERGRPGPRHRSRTPCGCPRDGSPPLRRAPSPAEQLLLAIETDTLVAELQGVAALEREIRRIQAGADREVVERPPAGVGHGVYSLGDLRVGQEGDSTC